MEKIPSFKKNHTEIMPGFSLSMTDKDITTFDLRFIKPNSGKYMSYAAIHTIEHVLATLLRNSEDKDSIIYFGPMGCRTGFYLLTRNLPESKVKILLKECLNKAAEITEIPGASENECGNYREHNLSAAKKYMAAYYEYLK